MPPPRPIEEQDTIPAGPRRVDAGTGTHRIGAPVPAASGPGGTRTMPRPSTDGPGGANHHPAVAGHEPPPHLRARRRSRRVFAAWIAIVLVLALIVGLTAWWLGVGRWTAMPAVIGLEQTTAQQLVDQADLVVRLTEAHDDGVAAGLVANSDPAPEARLLRGSVVELRVSAGRPTVPAVGPGHRNRRRRTGRARRRAHTRAGDGRNEYSSTVPAAPSSAPRRARGRRCRSALRHAGGQPRRPAGAGARAGAAGDRRTLREGLRRPRRSSGSTPRRTAAASRSAAENGVVIGQEPGPGSLVDPGTTITLDTI